MGFPGSAPQPQADLLVQIPERDARSSTHSQALQASLACRIKAMVRRVDAQIDEQTNWSDSMNSILVLCPSEDRAGRSLNLAFELASRTGARLTILRVLEEGIRFTPQRRARDAGREIRDLLIQAETKELEELAVPLISRGVEVEVNISWGVTWEVVVGLVEERGFDLVVKPARGLARNDRVFFGSTALHLFRKCPCPIWVVGDDGRVPAKILSAVGPSSGGARISVAERILGSANSLGRVLESPVHVVSAWHGPGKEALVGRVDQEELDVYLDDNRQRCVEALQEVLRQASPETEADHVHVVEGLAREVIPRFAEENAFDLIVLGTVGRSGVANELLGDTAEIILRDVRSSVLVLSPEHKTLDF